MWQTCRAVTECDIVGEVGPIRGRQLSGVIVLLVEYCSFPTSAMSVVSGIEGPSAEKLDLHAQQRRTDELPGSFPGHIVGPSQANYGPPELERASLRLQIPPSYILVGIYRLVTNQTLYKPAWDKCKHGTQRGLVVGFVWVCGFVFLLFMASDRWKNRLA